MRPPFGRASLPGLAKDALPVLVGDLGQVRLSVAACPQRGYELGQAGDVSELETHVSPSYMRKLPERDGWGLDLFVDSEPTLYTLASCGKGETNCTSLSVQTGGGKTSLFSDDIVFSGGSFVQWPEGKQE